MFLKRPYINFYILIGDRLLSLSTSKSSTISVYNELRIRRIENVMNIGKRS